MLSSSLDTRRPWLRKGPYNGPGRFPNTRRSRRGGACRQPRATRREFLRRDDAGTGSCRKTASSAQGGRPLDLQSGRPGEYGQSRRQKRRCNAWRQPPSPWRWSCKSWRRAPLNRSRAVSSQWQRGVSRALYVALDPLFLEHRTRIAELAAKYQLPAMYDVKEFVAPGGLMSYGPDFVDLFSRGAYFVDRIPQRHQTSGPARRTADRVQAGHQSQDRKGAWPHGPRHPCRPRRRGDRIAAR
jgi:hypothetical protein